MSFESTPRVSIGMPVYNGQRYLRLALDSMLNQTFNDFEIIISDNCSTDETRQIAEEFTRRDPRVRYLKQTTNIGAIGNFNHVFEEARGEYFKWAAHDDVCHPTFLEKCVKVLDDNPEVVWCHCDSDQIDEVGESWLEQLDPDEIEIVDYVDGQLRWVGLPRRNFDSPCASKRFAGVLLGTTWSADSYSLIRSSELRKTRMLQPFYGAEKVLMSELALRGVYHHIPEKLFAQRVHAEASGNITSSRFQVAFAMGGTGKAFAPTRFAILLGYLGAARHADISWLEKIKCYNVVLRYLLQLGKWKKIIVNSFLGHGIGGDVAKRLAGRSEIKPGNSNG